MEDSVVWHALQPSRALAALLAAITLLAASTVLVLDGPLWFLIPLAGLVFAFSVYVIRRQAYFEALDAIQAFRLTGGGMVEAQFADGSFRDLTVMRSTTLLGPLILLRLASDDGFGKVLSLIVLPDSLPGESVRQLRVWLRWKADVERGDETRARGGE